MPKVTILDLDQRTLWVILQLCFIAPTPCRFQCGPLKKAEIERNARLFRENCRGVFKRVKVLATPCHYFRTSALEGFIKLVDLLSANTTWTYSDGAKEPTVALVGQTAAVTFAILKWDYLMDGMWDELQKTVEFYKMKDKDALIEEQQVRIKKTELMLAEKEELIKGLKRELELALEQFSSSKRQRVAD